jgi:hypothetical protein
MELPAILGFTGDSINFISAVLLAWDPLSRKRVFLKQKADASLPTDVPFVDDKNKPIPRGDDLERVLVSGETTRARWGYALLILGFATLTLARGLEVYRPAPLLQLPIPCAVASHSCP